MSGMTATYRIELRDLQSLLQNKLGNDSVVTDYRTEPFLPFGENYGSTILKVQAFVKKRNEDNAQEFNLIAKMLPETDFQRDMFDSFFTFKREVFVYDQLIPAYQQLEREFGVKQVFDILPKFYGARISLLPDGEVDEDAVILMQNLKVEGYYSGDRRKGLDLDEGKVMMAALARFHGLGMAMKYHKPNVFKSFKTFDCVDYDDDEEDPMLSKSFLPVIRDDPEMSAYYEQCKPALTQDYKQTLKLIDSDPWITIVHADFWVNNVLFRNGPNSNRVVDVKFVDFQNALYMSPLRELTFCLMMNFNAEIMENKFDELLDLYYKNLVDVLLRMRCDLTHFTRDKFDERLRIDAFKEFPHIPFMIKITSANVRTDAKPDSIENIIMGQNITSLFIEKFRRCVKKYVDKKWL